MQPIRIADSCRILALSAAVGLLSFADRDVRAAEAAAGDQSTARALFDEALADMKADRWDSACPKLERGMLLDRGIGMRHNLALCYEHTGRLASAWTLFTEVSVDAAAQGESRRAQVARGHADAIEPKLSYIVLVVPDEARIAGLNIRRDGAPVAASAWGLKIPLDPGMHQIDASAARRRAWHMDVAVDRGGATILLKIPVLEPETPANRAIPVAAPTGLTTTRKLALVAGAVGVVGIAVGSIFGFRALSKNSESNESGCNGNVCTEGAAQIRRTARTAGDISTVGFVVGAAGLIGGAALWIVGKPTDSTGATLQPGHGSALAGITVQGAW